MSSNGIRVFTDSLGEVDVPASCYYGPQTERSKRNFKICRTKDIMPIQIIRALSMIKEAAAIINRKHNRISAEKASVIVSACREICQGKFDHEFPLVIWQTGSGTQTNMNVNEVIAGRASEILDGKRSSVLSIHPNDDVNNGQDAVPMTVGQELSGYLSQIRQSRNAIERELPYVCQLAIGGTAVGTGLNCATGFSEEVCGIITDIVAEKVKLVDGKPKVPLVFKPAENKFAALSGHDALLRLSGCFNTAATALMRLANDFCLLSSGPNCGFGEFILPANEPGSSIMPGKVNPTQCESLRMVCVQIMANHFAVTIASANGELELNVYKPLIAANLLHSCNLLSDSVRSFAKNCVDGLQLNLSRIQTYVDQSLMLVTALTPHIGYDKAAKLALHAAKSKLSLKEAAIQLQFLDAEQYDKWVKPRAMAFPHEINGHTDSSP